MKKVTFKMRNVIAIAICLAVSTVFSACDENADQTPATDTEQNDNNGENENENNNNGNNNGNEITLEGNPITASDLLLPQGYAWISGDGEWANGFVFLDNGSVLTVYRKNSAWTKSSTQNYSVEGNKITRFMLIGESRVNETVSAVNISADGDTLYILKDGESMDDVVTYKKTEVGTLN